MTAKVDWRGDEILAIVQAASDEVMHKLASETRDLAVENIKSDNLIDTGFMLNSAYIVTPLGDDYSATWKDGRYPVNPGKHGGWSGQARREKAPKVDLPTNADAAVVIGANYAIFQEIENFFLYLAAEKVVGRIGGIIGEIKL